MSGASCVIDSDVMFTHLRETCMPSSGTWRPPQTFVYLLVWIISNECQRHQQADTCNSINDLVSKWRS